MKGIKYLLLIIAIAVVSANSVIGQEYSTQADRLGYRWLESESGWDGIWTRKGNSNTFDAVWTHKRKVGRITAKLTIRIEGNRVYIERRNSSDGNDCDYEGTLSNDGSRIAGQHTCGKNLARKRAGSPYYSQSWEARIEGGKPAPEPEQPQDDDYIKKLILRSRTGIFYIYYYEYPLDEDVTLDCLDMDFWGELSPGENATLAPSLGNGMWVKVQESEDPCPVRNNKCEFWLRGVRGGRILRYTID